MDQNLMILAGMGIIALLLCLVLYIINHRFRMDGEARQIAADKATETISDIMKMNAGLETRLKTMSENHVLNQEEMKRTMHERLDAVSKRVGESLEKTTEKTGKSLGELQTRLAVIDGAQKKISELSGEMVSLQEILANKQQRGAFGEIQLNDLISAILPPSAYSFQETLGNGKRADCLIKLPNPPGAIVVDSKFPLEGYRKLIEAKTESDIKSAQRQFRTDIQSHIKAIAEKYIIPGETAESALMFLPSEAVYAELHSNFLDVVDKSYEAKVFMVSPTTLMATLNTIRAVLKDARIRDQAGVIQKHVTNLIKDVGRLDDRVGKLKTHLRQSEGDIEDIFKSTRKITSNAEKIEKIQLEDVDDVEDAIEPKSTPPTKLLID